MVDLSGMWRRARAKGREVAADAPAGARQAAGEARRTARAMGEVIDERTDGRFTEAVAKGNSVIGGVVSKPSEAVDAYRKEAGRGTHRPEAYRPDPIDAPTPIDRPEPL